ncbi:hypothetical protein Btru_063760 [Bulinus truncatus]|nr:hypothetical protein Btru_063760 [Bulinus truncatus]
MAVGHRTGGIHWVLQLATTAPTPESRLRVVSPGTNLQPGEMEIFLPTAVHYPNFPARGGFNLFLSGWARHNGDMSFKCCLLRSLPTGELDDETFTEVQAYGYFEYDQWLVDMQAAEFSCSVSGKQIASIGGDANHPCHIRGDVVPEGAPATS